MNARSGEPLTVFVYFPYLSGGKGSMGIFCRDLCQMLAEHGHLPVMCAIKPAGLTAREVTLPARMRTGVGRIDALLLDLLVRRAASRTPPARRRILNVSHEFVLRGHYRRSLTIVHDTIQAEFPRSRLVRLLAPLWWRSCRRVAGVVAVSRATAHDLAGLGIESTVIRNHFDVEQFRAFTPEDDGGYDAVWIGTFAPHKRFDLFADLAAANPEQRFAALVPDDQAPTDLPANLILLSGLDQPALWTLIARSGLLVSTSQKEGYGRPPMEALMLGTPVLVADIPVYRELFDGLGQFFRSGSAGSLIAAYSRARATLRQTPDWPRLLERQGSIADYVPLLEAVGTSALNGV